MPATSQNDQLIWRIVFGIAAIYNLALGAWAVLFPTAFFKLFDLETPQYLWLWSCLGMVIGIYGLGYGYVAMKPDRGDVIVVLGFLGKVFGPIGWLLAIHHGEIPPRTFPIILLNDLIWWFPFIAYLLRHMESRRIVIALLAAALHLAASVLLWLARHGTEFEPDVAARAAFIQGNMALWTTCWFLWSASSLSLLAFFMAWTGRLRELRAPMKFVVIGCGLCAIGLHFDLTSETLAIVVLTDSSMRIEEWMRWTERTAWCGAGMANGLYAVAGIVMSILSWRLGLQRGALGVLALAVWLSACGLTIATFTRQENLMAVFGGALMILFIPWATLTGLFSFRK